jgi:transcriptional regulator with XRE-family HTH domain
MAKPLTESVIRYGTPERLTVKEAAVKGAAFSRRAIGALAHLRRDQKWLAGELARRFNYDVSSTTLNRWINGRREPTFEETRMVSVCLAVDPGWLAFGDASEAPAPKLSTNRQGAGTGHVARSRALLKGAVDKKRASGGDQ